MKKPSKVTPELTKFPKLWLGVFGLLFLVLVGVLILGELQNWSGRRLFIDAMIVLTWFNFMRVEDRYQRFIKKPLIVGFMAITIALAANIGLHLLNVYGLGRLSNVQAFCQMNSGICSAVVSAFYQLKVYRFITLSVTLFLSGLALLGGLLLITSQKDQLIATRKKYSAEPLLIVIGFAFLTMYLWQVMAVADQAFVLGIKSWQNRHVSFLDRFVPYEFGIEHHGWIWEFGKFIRATVPDTATIFIPPQSDIWPQEGNKYYFRWFVYPIGLVQSSDPVAKIPDEAGYILISRGGWKGGAAGWPKKPLLVSCVAEVQLIDRLTLDQRTLMPEELSQGLSQNEWGVIKLQGESVESCL